MFYKNIMAYRFAEDKPWHYSGVELEEFLQSAKFVPCEERDFSKMGFDSPYPADVEADRLEDGKPVIYCEVGDIIVLKITIDKKQIPSDYVKRQVEQQKLAIEKEEGETLSYKELAKIKEDVILSLCPNAPIKRSHINLMIDKAAQMIYVEGTASKSAESALALLRKAIGSLPIGPINTQDPIPHTLTGLCKTYIEQLDQDGFDNSYLVPGTLLLGDSYYMVSLGDEKRRGSGADFSSNTFALAVVEENFKIQELEIGIAPTPTDRMYFTLNAAGVIKKIQWPEMLLYKNVDEIEDNLAALFDANVLLAATTINQLLTTVFTVIQADGYLSREAEHKRRLADHESAKANEPLFHSAMAIAELANINAPAPLGAAMKTSMAVAERLWALVAFQRQIDIDMAEKIKNAPKVEITPEAELSAEQDCLYSEALTFVLETRRSSISALQRKLKIGFNRAARLIELMEHRGVVSAQGHNGNREVLLPPEFIDAVEKLGEALNGVTVLTVKDDKQ